MRKGRLRGLFCLRFSRVEEVLRVELHFKEGMVYVKTLSFDPCAESRMGAICSGRHRDQGRKTFLHSVDPDTRSRVRVGEEGPSQQCDSHGDESDGKYVVHKHPKALAVPKGFKQ